MSRVHGFVRFFFGGVKGDVGGGAGGGAQSFTSLTLHQEINSCKIWSPISRFSAEKLRTELEVERDSFVTQF